MTTTADEKPKVGRIRGEQFGPLLVGDVARVWAALHTATVIAQVADIVRERAERFDQPFAATVARARQLGVDGIVSEARVQGANDKDSLLTMHVSHWDGPCAGPATQLALMVEDLVRCDFCGCREAHWRHKEHGFPCEPAVMQPIMQAEHEADKERWKRGTPIHEGRLVVTRSGYSLDEHAPAWFRWTDSLGLSSYHSASGSYFWEANDDRGHLGKYARWYIEETQAKFVTFDLFGSAARDEAKIAVFAADVRAREVAHRTALGLTADEDAATASEDEDDVECGDELEDEFEADDFDEDDDNEAVLTH